MLAFPSDDGLGSTTDLTDASGNTLATYSYDVFGAVRAQSGTSGNYWQFTGEQRDGDSGLYYLRARYYDPTIGRFLGKDPLNIGNRYSYVSNNPVNYTDPYGLFGLGDITDCLGDPIECGEEVIEAGEDVVGDIFDQIHITLEGVLVGGVLVVVGEVLMAGGLYVCVSIIMFEAPNPETWPAIPHSLGICSAVAGVGFAVYLCGWSLIWTSWCAEPLPADTAEAAVPGAGKE